MYVFISYPRGAGVEKLKYERNDVSVFNDKLNSKPKYAKNIKIKILNTSEYCMIDTYNAFGGEKVLNFATEDLFDKRTEQ